VADLPIIAGQPFRLGTVRIRDTEVWGSTMRDRLLESYGETCAPFARIFWRRRRRAMGSGRRLPGRGARRPAGTQAATWVAGPPALGSGSTIGPGPLPHPPKADGSQCNTVLLDSLILGSLRLLHRAYSLRWTPKPDCSLGRMNPSSRIKPPSTTSRPRSKLPSRSR